MIEPIPLPQAVRALCKARAALQAHYAGSGLSFTLDGKLVGDIGEVIAAEAFDLELCSRRTKAIDAIAKDGRTVQIKASGNSKSGPSYTPGEGSADHLLFVYLNFEEGSAQIRYNGPEAPIRAMLPAQWHGTSTLRLRAVLAADQLVAPSERLTVAKS